MRELTLFETAAGRVAMKCGSCEMEYVAARASVACPLCSRPMTAVTPCPHRGAATNVAPCGCGSRGKTVPVYACLIHGECLEHANGKAGGKKYHICATCEDYQRSLPQDAPGGVREGSAGG